MTINDDEIRAHLRGQMESALDQIKESDLGRLIEDGCPRGEIDNAMAEQAALYERLDDVRRIR